MSVAARISQRLKALLGPATETVPRSWLHCPICDRVLTGPYHAGMINHRLGYVREPSRAELVAKCPVHGQRPYNDPNKRPAVRRVPKR